MAGPQLALCSEPRPAPTAQPWPTEFRQRCRLAGSQHCIIILGPGVHWPGRPVAVGGVGVYCAAVAACEASWQARRDRAGCAALLLLLASPARPCLASLCRARHRQPRYSHILSLTHSSIVEPALLLHHQPSTSQSIKSIFCTNLSNFYVCSLSFTLPF